MVEGFNSCFRAHMDNMLAYKEAMGFSKSTYRYYLDRFDKHCLSLFPYETILTKELVLSWAKTSGTESANTFRRRLACIREFARYLQSVGLPAYLFPDKMAAARQAYVPHIFTNEELKAFFYGADHYEKYVCDPLRHLIIPVVFRLIYCCGLRPSEGLLIKTDDIDLTTGRLCIRQAKRHKDRVVMLSDDLLKLCGKYAEELKGCYGETKYFFPSINGKPYGTVWLRYNFHKCWRNAGIASFTEPKPRVYDFRHTFATRCLYQWMEGKEDLYFCLPYLSAYMGHSNFSSTAYYIHLLPERLAATEAINWLAFEELIPEVPE